MVKTWVAESDRFLKGHCDYRGVKVTREMRMLLLQGSAGRIWWLRLRWKGWKWQRAVAFCLHFQTQPIGYADWSRGGTEWMKLTMTLGSDGTMYRVEEHWKEQIWGEGRGRKKLSLELLGVRCLTNIQVQMWREQCNRCIWLLQRGWDQNIIWELLAHLGSDSQASEPNSRALPTIRDRKDEGLPSGQWLKLHASTATGTGLILIEKLRVHMPSDMAKKERERNSITDTKKNRKHTGNNKMWYYECQEKKEFLGRGSNHVFQTLLWNED